MIGVSNTFRALVGQDAPVQVRATLRLADGTVEQLSGGDVMYGTMAFSDATSGSGSFDVGAAVTGQLTLSLNNFDGRFDDHDFTGATITAFVGVETSPGTVEWVQRGVYNVEQPAAYGGIIALQALDDMVMLERPYSDVGTGYPATLGVIVTDICTRCGVTLGSAAFANASYTVPSRPDDSSLTCKAVLAYAAQASGNWARFDARGRLWLDWYDTSLDEGDWAPGTGEHADVTAIASSTIVTDDVVVTGVRVTAQGTDAQEGETYAYGQAGYVLDLPDNPLVRLGQAQAVATQVGQRVVGMTFRPFELRALGDPTLEPGDPVLIVDRTGAGYRSYVTRLDYRVGAYASLACDAETPSRRSASTYSALTRALVENRKAVRRERTARETAVAALEREIADSSGLYYTVEPQQDGSVIRYYHDRPELSESEIVWKFVANAFAMSTDGGQTYPYGIDVTGNAILDRVYAIGIDAQYITTGRVGSQATGAYIDFDTGDLSLGSGTPYGSGTLGDALNDAARTATDYLRYADGELTIGATDAAVRNVMTNQLQAYRTDAGDVAWFGLNASGIWEMFIQTASVQDRLSFGDFSWIARQNGNMTLKWMGA